MLTAVVRAVTLVVFLHETGGESCLLDRPVRHELDPETVGGGFDVFRHLVTAVSPEQRRAGTVPVSDLQEIVDAVVMVLNLE